MDVLTSDALNTSFAIVKVGWLTGVTTGLQILASASSAAVKLCGLTGAVHAATGGVLKHAASFAALPVIAQLLNVSLMALLLNNVCVFGLSNFTRKVNARVAPTASVGSAAKSHVTVLPATTPPLDAEPATMVVPVGAVSVTDLTTLLIDKMPVPVLVMLMV